MTDTFDYQAFGLRVRSDMRLPFAPSEDRGLAPQVRVELGPIPEDAVSDGLAWRNWRADPGRLLLNVLSVGRILVTDGDAIRVDLKPGTCPDDIMSHVQGSAFAAILQQRGTLPMHASAVETGSGAVLSMGPSGVGKSTLLGALLDRGFRMIADDVVPVSIDADGVPNAIPAYPNARLWRDSLASLGAISPTLTAVRFGITKYYLPISAFRTTPQPIRAILVLAAYNGDAITIEPLAPAERMRLLARYTYRKNFLAGLGQFEQQFTAIAAMMRHAAVFQVRRPQAPLDPYRLADAVIEHLEMMPDRVAAATA